MPGSIKLRRISLLSLPQEVPCGGGESEGLTEGSDLINNVVLLHDRECTSYSSAREIPFMCKTSFLLFYFLTFMFVL